VIGVLVSGEGTNLQALIDAGLPIVAVASNKPGVRALERAEQAGIVSRAFPLEEHESREERDGTMASWLTENGAELVVCAGYMHLLTKPFLELYPERVINVHPSLLPSFPGARAVRDALASGVTETGVTVHVVDEGLDTGPVLIQEPVPIRPHDTVESLTERIHAVEHRLLPVAVERYFRP
jgi:phosphoribosylglycinamide formyltransferase 1